MSIFLIRKRHKIAMLSEDEHEKVKNREKFAARIKYLIKIVVAILVSLYGYLEFRDVGLGPYVNDQTASLLHKTSLAIYFTSWAFGASFDVNIQNEVYSGFDDQRPPIKAYPFFLMFVVIFAGMCYTNSPYIFALFLGALWIFNVTGFLFMMHHFVHKFFKDSYMYFEEKGFCKSRMKLEIVDEYMRGSWQRIRFAYGGVYIVAMISVFHFNLLHYIPQYHSITSPSFISSAIVFAFVLSFEGWIWCQRIAVTIKVNQIDDIFEDYTVKISDKYWGRLL